MRTEEITSLTHSLMLFIPAGKYATKKDPPICSVTASERRDGGS